MDPRATKLAEILVNHSVKVTKGSNVIIDASDMTARDLIHECYRLSLLKGANVYLDIFGSFSYYLGRGDAGGFMKMFLDTANPQQLTTEPPFMKAKLDWMDKIIRITTIHNRKFLANTDPKKLGAYQKGFTETFHKSTNKDWVLTYWPTVGTAQNANMSLEEFMDYYYQASTIDYIKQGKRIKKLQDIIDKGKVVRIVAKDTDLTLGIAGRFAAGADSGKHNVPDGECFTGPEENKTEGYVTFEYPQIYSGNEVSGIRLEYKKGQIVKWSAETNQKFLDSIFKEDPANRRLGELGIGMNDMIKSYIKDILFDEKIMGTVHMAVGQSYDDKRGGGKNKGTVHWDMIKDLRHKGSLVTVDNKPIIKDGKILI